MMEKKPLALLLAILMVMALAVTACSSPGSAKGSDDGQTTINLWDNFISETEITNICTEEFIEEYTAAHPDVKIERHVLEDSAYKSKLLTEFSGSASNIDVFAYWGAGRAGDLVDAGKLLCLDSYLEPDQVAAFKPGSEMNFLYDGKLYGVPQASWMLVLYCNNELFEQYGVKLPGTYDELLDACKAFAATDVCPIALGGGKDDAWLAAFVYEGLANRLVGAEDEMAVLNSLSGFAGNPGFSEAAAKMIELQAAGAFGRNPLEIDEGTADAQFISGAAAMRLNGSWFTDGIYSDEESVVAGKVSALPFPMVDGGKGKPTDYVGGFIDGYFINKETANPEIAVDFAYGLSVAMCKAAHETGEGFTAYTYPVDESGLPPLAVELADLADRMDEGVLAWDTFLPGDLADIHLNACQALLGANSDVQKFMDAYQEIFG